MKFYPYILFILSSLYIQAQTPQSRLLAVTDKFSDPADKVAVILLMKKAKEVIRNHVSASGGSCSDAKRVEATLKSNGIEVGKGATFAYWKWKYPQYESFNHTAPSIVYKGQELIIDVTHMQFRGVDPLDEQIICLSPTEWMDELVTRTKGQNPVLSLSIRSGEELYSYVCPECTKPALTEAQKAAVEEFDRLDDIRLKAQIRREINDRRRERCAIM